MIAVDMVDGVAVATMTHGKANALDIDFCHGLADWFAAQRTSETTAIVLTGQGAIFSAGVDLKRLSAAGVGYVREFLPALHRLYDAVFFHPRPVIAAVNGHAIAGGAVLAACADRRILARGKSRIGVTELQVGVPFPALAFEILRLTVPPRYLSEFTLGAATYAADDALAKGWVDELVEPEALMARALAVAKAYAALSPQAFAQTKTQIRQPVTERMALSGEAVDSAVTAIWTAPESLKRVGDYVAKTLTKS